MAAQAAPIQFRDKLLEVEIQVRTPEEGESPSLIARRDLERYYRLLARSLPAFSKPEAELIVQACSGWHPDADSVHFLWAQVDEAIRSRHLDQEDGVDAAALVDRLRELTPFEAMAVVDAAEINWYVARPKGIDVQGYVYTTDDVRTTGLTGETWPLRRKYGEPEAPTIAAMEIELERISASSRARRARKQQEGNQP